ncbi:DNA primase [Bacillus salacetis]|uniref:DNA primase n=1 Tax=Bacillus salacetis TaxID=2315464 RepID=A0A3A1RAS4_9BACI|nr:DNA primase [Bacillus salacetis]RIW37572.1 DNA primase [Bacillus salacetis]
MTGRIPEEKVNEIRQSIDIVDVIGDYVQLKKQGRNYFGLCPFHGESTPSFSVSPDKQIFHCFGCGAGGNAYTFLMDIDGISFQEAVVKLAGKAGQELSVDVNQVETTASRDEEKMIEAHELLSKFYHHLLVNTKEGQDALEYLLERGFTRESIDKFQIGWSLPSWEFTVNFLTKRGFPPDLMEQAGLLVKRENEDHYFDRFRGRVMFPIRDHRGKTIAFSGRAMGGEEPKYLNSPETKIFNKSSVLYNFNNARPVIRRKSQAILFEGFADVISADSAGVENGIASMGTSLTPKHMQMLKRMTDSVVICYDGDKAGIEAAFRAAKMLNEEQFNIRISMIPEKLDPDDYIKKYSAEKFQNDVIGASLTFMAFKLIYFRQGKNLNDEGDRLQYIEEVLKEVSALQNHIERDYYLRQLADEFSLSLQALEQQQKQIYFSSKKSDRREQRNQDFAPRVQPKAENKLFPAYHTAERRLIAHMMKDPDIAFKVQNLLNGSSFNLDEHQAIITYLFGYYEEGNEADSSGFIQFLPDSRLRRVVSEIGMMSISDECSEQELIDYVNQVLKHQKMLTIKEKQLAQKEAERQNDYKKAALIAMEILQLRKSL